MNCVSSRPRISGASTASSETGDSDTLNYIEANKIPCVLVDRLASSKLDRVGIQNKYAMGMVVGHLAGHGHRRIGFISGQSGFATAIERTEGFRAALSERGLAFDETPIRSGDGQLAWRIRPDAVMKMVSPFLST